MATKTIKKYKNVYEKIDSYVPVQDITEDQLEEEGFMISKLGDALKVIELSDNPFNNYMLNIMIDPEDSERSHNFVIDGMFDEIKIENDTEEMNILRNAVFEELDNLVEEGILEVAEDVELIAPTYRNKNK